MRTKVNIYFDTHKKIQTGQNKGLYPVKIVVNFYDMENRRTRRYYNTGVYCSAVDFKRIISGNTGRGPDADELDTKRKTVLACEQKAKDEAKNHFDPDTFEAAYTSAGSKTNPLDMLLSYASELERNGDIGTARFYKNAYSIFNKYTGGRLAFFQVTPKWLMGFERWFLNQVDEKGNPLNRSVATVGTHTRNLRTIFNQAIAAKKIPPEMYPFARNPSDRDKYKCPTTTSRKIALTEIQKNKLLEYKGEHQRAVDLWKFSYYCNGMNFTDMANLKYRNIENDVLIFHRKKTKKTDRNKAPIVVTLDPEIHRIILRWGNRNINPDEYIFQVLRKELTAKQEKNLIVDWIKDTNEALAKVCKELKLPEITTYWARHTFASILHKKGVPIGHIQEFLGHSDERTTKGYLASLDVSARKKVNKYL